MVPTSFLTTLNYIALIECPTRMIQTATEIGETMSFHTQEGIRTMEGKARTKEAQKAQAKIVVTGDVTVDWFEVATPPKESSSTEVGYEFNWEIHPMPRFVTP